MSNAYTIVWNSVLQETIVILYHVYIILVVEVTGGYHCSNMILLVHMHDYQRDTATSGSVL